MRRKRILIVNCYFDGSHRPLRRAFKIPQAVGPLYLAGTFSRDLCDVRCYSELASGPLEDEKLLAWPDMLVLTGLTNSFDRMLHLTAYARSKNERVIVVAGGPAVRALPRLASRFFDYSCLGDIEELQDVVADVFGTVYVAEQTLPRYDLGYWLGSIGYAETTRHCNFRCTFCALTGEDRTYQSYSLDYIRQQIRALGHRSRVIFVDNNFYGNDREQFAARINLLKEIHQAGQLKSWSALVTNDFFMKRDNVRLAKQAGCELLFSGVESFNAEWLHSMNKLQNSGPSQTVLIEDCLKQGVVFSYGLMADFRTRTIEDFRRELEFIFRTPEITLPSYITVQIPILGTPYFYDSIAQKRILPNIKLRDMDGATILEKPLDPICNVVKFLADDVQTFNGYSLRVLWHASRFAKVYRKRLTKAQLIFATGGALMQCAHRWSFSLRLLRRLGKDAPRTHISATELLDQVYTPAFRLESRFERHFRPTMVTDQNGEVHVDLLDSGLFNNEFKATASLRGD